MKIFVTGSTGFVGSHFVNAALRAGHSLVCLRRPGSQPRVNLEREPEWQVGSLEDDWREVLQSCDTFVHLAAHSTNVPYDTLGNCLYWNLTVALRLMEQVLEVGIQNFLVAGTGFEYGRSGERYDYIPVTAALEPTMSYPASKAAAAIALTQWAIEHQIKLHYLRIFQVFGVGEAESRLWPSLHEAALAGDDFQLTPGNQVRDFTPVEVVAQQLLCALDFSKVQAGEPLFKHIGTGCPQTLREFAEHWWKYWNAKGALHFGAYPYRDNEIMRYVPEILVGGM